MSANAAVPARVDPAPNLPEPAQLTLLHGGGLARLCCAARSRKKEPAKALFICMNHGLW